MKKKLEILNRFGLRDGAHVKEQKSVNSCGEQQTGNASINLKHQNQFDSI